jgi:hypothetical protein
MAKTTDLSEAKRALLEKYLLGELPQTSISALNDDEPPQGSPKAQPSADSRVSLVTVQDGGAKLPFFYVHVHWDTGAYYCFKEEETYFIPGKHFSLITDQLPILSTLLKTCLGNLHGAGDGGATGDIGSRGKIL